MICQGDVMTILPPLSLWQSPPGLTNPQLASPPIPNVIAKRPLHSFTHPSFQPSNQIPNSRCRCRLQRDAGDVPNFKVIDSHCIFHIELDRAVGPDGIPDFIEYRPVIDK